MFDKSDSSLDSAHRPLPLEVGQGACACSGIRIARIARPFLARYVIISGPHATSIRPRASKYFVNETANVNNGRSRAILPSKPMREFASFISTRVLRIETRNSSRASNFKERKEASTLSLSLCKCVNGPILRNLGA